MYEVRNNRNEVLSNDMVLNVAKGRAEEMAEADKKYGFGNGPFSIYRVEQIWTTQTLEEALK